MKILNHMFLNGGNVCVVATRSEPTGEIKFRIKGGETLAQMSPNEAIQKTAEWGNTLDPQTMFGFFNVDYSE